MFQSRLREEGDSYNLCAFAQKVRSDVHGVSISSTRGGGFVQEIWTALLNDPEFGVMFQSRLREDPHRTRARGDSYDEFVDGECLVETNEVSISSTRRVPRRGRPPKSGGLGGFVRNLTRCPESVHWRKLPVSISSTRGGGFVQAKAYT